VPVHMVAERAGHANPTITLTTYAHLIGGDDERAADVADEMLRRFAEVVAPVKQSARRYRAALAALFFYSGTNPVPTVPCCPCVARGFC
jgi:hypothetical protein